MNIVDSSAWLEYFTDGPNAKYFAPPIENTRQLIVPAICLYEVFKKVLKERGEKAAFQSVGLMNHGKVIPLDATLALNAAAISLEYKLPMADSIVFTTALNLDGILWTQDANFKNISGVKYFPKT